MSHGKGCGYLSIGVEWGDEKVIYYGAGDFAAAGGDGDDRDLHRELFDAAIYRRSLDLFEQL